MILGLVAWAISTASDSRTITISNLPGSVSASCCSTLSPCCSHVLARSAISLSAMRWPLVIRDRPGSRSFPVASVRCCLCVSSRLPSRHVPHLDTNSYSVLDSFQLPSNCFQPGVRTLPHTPSWSVGTPPGWKTRVGTSRPLEGFSIIVTLLTWGWSDT